MLDPDRQRTAATRVADLLTEARFHERRAAALRASAAGIAQTWNLSADSLDNRNEARYASTTKSGPA